MQEEEIRKQRRNADIFPGKGLYKCPRCGKFKTSDHFDVKAGVMITFPCRECKRQLRGE